MKRVRIRLASLAALLLLVAVSVFINAHAAASAKQSAVRLYLSPDHKTMSFPGTLTLSVYEDSSTQLVNAVQANLKYDTRMLKYKSIDSSRSAFEIAASTSGGKGSIDIARGHVGSLTGKQLVAKVSFTVLSRAHRTPVKFVRGTALVSTKSHTNILTNSAGGKYSTK